MAGGTPGRYLNDFNQALNVYPALKNMEYEVDGRFVYKTDANGNVSEMTDKNIQYPTPVRERNLTEETTNSKKKGGKSTDAGGHIASNEANGPSEQINYWPIDGPSNSGGAWRNMEREIKRLTNPTGTFKVIYKVKSFTGGRPDKFEVDLYNGTTFVQRFNIDN